MNSSVLENLNDESIPLLNIVSMNTTHYEEIKLVKNLGVLITDYQENKEPSLQEANEITQSLKHWIEHTEAHFSRENKLMQDYGFPALPVHESEHLEMLKKIETVATHWRETQDTKLLVDFALNYWPTWFVNHINTMDCITSRFLEMKGYSEAEKDE